MAIDKRSNGSFRARYRDAAGKEHARHFKRKTDARAWLDEVTAQTVTGMYVDPVMGKITFRQYWDDWAERQLWVGTSKKNKKGALESITFGDIPIREIRRSHIEYYIKRQLDDGYAPSTISGRVGFWRSAFRSAVRDRIIPSDPTDGVRLPRERAREHSMKIPTPEEVGQVIAGSLTDDFRLFISLCAYAGLRSSEACALKISDVDFLRRSLHVERQWIADEDGTMEFRPPKYGSERTVYLPDDLLLMLSQANTYGEDRFLFTSRKGDPPRSETQLGRWRDACRRAGVDQDFTIHDLRHFFASGLIASGCDPVTVQRALGHKNATVTLNTYSHLWPKAEDRTRAAAADLMRQVSGRPADNLRTFEDGTTL